MKVKIKALFIVIGIILIGLLGYLLWHKFAPDVEMFFNPDVSKEILMNKVRSHGISTGVLLVLLTSIMCAIPGLPTSIIGVLIGICYGPLVGSILNIIGNTLGNILSIFLIRKFKFIDKSKTSNHWVKTISRAKHPDIGITFAYMIPVIPSFLVNYTTTIMNVKAKRLIWMVLFGALPSSVLYAFGGDAFFKGNHEKAILLVASVLILILLVFLIEKDAKSEHSKIKK